MAQYLRAAVSSQYIGYYLNLTLLTPDIVMKTPKLTIVSTRTLISILGSL